MSNAAWDPNSVPEDMRAEYEELQADHANMGYFKKTMEELFSAAPNVHQMRLYAERAHRFAQQEMSKMEGRMAQLRQPDA